MSKCREDEMTQLDFTMQIGAMKCETLYERMEPKASLLIEFAEEKEKVSKKVEVYKGKYIAMFWHCIKGKGPTN